MIVVALKFPDVLKIADFIIDHKIEDVETYSRTVVLIGFLSAAQIDAACNDYGAKLVSLPTDKKMNDVKDE